MAGLRGRLRGWGTWAVADDVAYVRDDGGDYVGHGRSVHVCDV